MVAQEKHADDEVWQGLREHPFGSLTNNYTLILGGYFDDCGEFGGHEETIEILRIEGILNGIVTIYDKSCQGKNYPKPKVISTQTYLIDENKVKLIQNYLSKLLIKSLEYDIIYHAGRTYTARMEYRKDDEDDDFRDTRLNLRYNDAYSTWTEFQTMKSIVEE